MDAEIEQVLKDFPPGPLSPYRKAASFKWKEMRLAMEGKDSLLLKVCCCIFIYVTETEILLAHLCPVQSVDNTGEGSPVCSPGFQTRAEGLPLANIKKDEEASGI